MGNSTAQTVQMDGGLITKALAELEIFRDLLDEQADEIENTLGTENTAHRLHARQITRLMKEMKAKL